MTVTAEQVHAGQAVYSKLLLSIYDLCVLGFSNRFIWRCPTPQLLAHYDAHASSNHLDVGVGTGYLLDHCQFPSPTPRVALMDLNANTLQYTAKRIGRYEPETYTRKILEPIVNQPASFDSVGVNYLLHCLPGTMREKSIAFDHLRPLMNPRAVIFGSTLLQGGVERSIPAKRLMALYNDKGVSSNSQDDLDTLTQEPGARFDAVGRRTVGCCALFAGRQSE